MRDPRPSLLPRCLGALGVAAGLAGAACRPSPPPARAESCLLISIDSLRADHLASYGYDRVTSPTLDRLAAEGARFETVVAETSWTLPTHLSMLTGLTSNVHRVLEDRRRLDPARVTLAEVFRDAGRETFGVWSGPYLHAVFGFDQGFAEGDWVGALGRLPLDAEGFELAEESDDTRRSIQRAHGRSHRSVTSPEVTERALAFLAERGHEPFFLFVHYFDVHYDYLPPEAYWRRFDPDYAGDLSPHKFIGNPEIHRDMAPRDLRHVLARYDGEILWVDEHVGRLVAALEERGLDESTLVVVTSDHGEEFFEHGFKGHRRTLFDEVLLVPLVFWQPGSVAAGVELAGQVRHIDVMPTVLEWCGLDVPAEVMGRSLAAGLAGERVTYDLPALTRLGDPEEKDHWTALRTGEWKLVRKRKRRGGGEESTFLFDLERDPRELRPLEGRAGEARRATAERRLASLEERERAQRDALPLTGDDGVEVPEELQADLRGLGYTE